MKAVGYLVSRYPSVSHSFIRREVAALRGKGVDIRTFAIRRPKDPGSLGEEDRAEYERTWAVLPASPAAAVSAHLWAFFRSPSRWFDTLLLACRHRTPGVKGLLWGAFHLTEALILAREMDRRGIGRIHSHFSNSGGTVGLLASRFLRVPWSVTLHGKADFFSPTTPLLAGKIRLADFVVCVSSRGRALAMMVSPPSEWGKLRVVRCGLDLRAIPALAGPPEPPPVRILSVGRLSPEKGQAGLLQAVAGLAAGGLDVECLILGEGPSRPVLEEEIRRLGLEGIVRLPGRATEGEVFREMASSHVFVLSSFFEGIPVVLMEAMAHRLPVAAPRIGGIPELLREGESGFLFSPGEWGELEDRLRTLVRDEGLRREMRRKGRARVEDLHDVSRNVSALAEGFSSPG